MMLCVPQNSWNKVLYQRTKRTEAIILRLSNQCNNPVPAGANDKWLSNRLYACISEEVQSMARTQVLKKKKYFSLQGLLEPIFH